MKRHWFILGLVILFITSFGCGSEDENEGPPIDPASVSCPTKIVKGDTKAQVQSKWGEPDSIKTKTDSTIWYYIKYSGTGYTQCSIYFELEKGTLAKVDDNRCNQNCYDITTF